MDPCNLQGRTSGFAYFGDRFYRLARGLMTRPGTFPQGIIRVDRRLRILKMRRRQANYLDSIKDMAMLDILGSSICFFFSFDTLEDPKP